MGKFQGSEFESESEAGAGADATKHRLYPMPASTTSDASIDYIRCLHRPDFQASDWKIPGKFTPWKILGAKNGGEGRKQKCRLWTARYWT